MKIIGIPGSSREQSFNKRFLVWVGELLKDHNVELEVVDISQIPLVMGERVGNVPDSVKNLKKLIKNSDGIIFSTPQYNYTYPLILKNLIDWIKYPTEDNSWVGKKGYIVGVSMDTTGVLKAESKLRSYMSECGMLMFEGELIAINRADGIFDDKGGLLNKEIENKAKVTISELVKWLQKSN